MHWRRRSHAINAQLPRDYQCKPSRLFVTEGDLGASKCFDSLLALRAVAEAAATTAAATASTSVTAESTAATTTTAAEATAAATTTTTAKATAAASTEATAAALTTRARCRVVHAARIWGQRR